MFNHHDAPEHIPQLNADMPSATRPPQLNKTVCGCRCGRGGGRGQESEGANNDNDAASTLVASDDYDLEGYTSNEPERNASFETRERNTTAARFHEEFQARIGLLLNGANGRLEVTDMRVPSPDLYQVERLEDRDDSIASMRNEPASDVHSVVTPDTRSVRCISPGPGLGAWINDFAQEYQIPLDYHFHMRPLRLTPQYRYCRGLVASHLILRDEAEFENEGDRLRFLDSEVVNNLYRD